MNEHRREILDMLATGKITAEEADRLIAAMDKDRGQTVGAVSAAAEPGPRPQPKYLRVLVEAEEEKDGPVKVNVRVPMQLLRAGVRLASLIPAQARDQVNEAMREKGVVLDLNQIKPENLEELVNQLNDLTVDVDQGSNKVRVFCE
jgi:D-serine deaminase-like pyridoxal phosphate-dependent protein